MRLHFNSTKPIHHFPAVSVLPGSRGFAWIEIPLHHATTPTLPGPLEALLIAGDLQAVDDSNQPIEQRRLAGIAIAEQCVALAEAERLPDPKKTGVLLAGDLYTDFALQKRGGTGDVRPVWEAFAARFRWVYGVAGNHDLFGQQAQPPWQPPQGQGELLHGTSVQPDGLHIAGISGVIGKSEKPWRILLKDHTKMVRNLLAKTPDILLLHEGPQDFIDEQTGNADILKALQRNGCKSLVVCGHRHWKNPIASNDKMQILNVDFRMVLVTAEV